ncbi:MAG: restriction endonuclease [Nitrospinae bacterium]|nr:restriction endonuclease [Nitrospinota bacterium]
MFLTVIIAVVVGFLLILAMKKTPPPVSHEQSAAELGDGTELALSTLTLERFDMLCRSLLQALGLDIERSTKAGNRAVDMMAVNPAPIIGGQYLVHGELLERGEVVETVQVLALLDAVKGEGASKGVLITNGFFSDEAGKAAAGGPIELINGVRFWELLQRFDTKTGLSAED